MERMVDFFADVQAVAGIVLILCLLYIHNRNIEFRQPHLDRLIFFMIVFESGRILFPQYAPIMAAGLRISFIFIFLKMAIVAEKKLT